MVVRLQIYVTLPCCDIPEDILYWHIIPSRFGRYISQCAPLSGGAQYGYACLTRA